MTSRRGFLIGIGAALAAPAIVRAESIMRVVAPKLIVADPVFVPYGLSPMQEMAAAISEAHVAIFDAAMHDLFCFGQAQFEIKPGAIADVPGLLRLVPMDIYRREQGLDA